jgi:hypothetical protein
VHPVPTTAANNTQPVKCARCRWEFHYSVERCPHCGDPGNYSNVIVASQQHEQLEVERRYQAALQDTNRRGCALVRQEFETWIATCSAVTARSLPKVEELAASDKVVYPTYYDLADAGLRIPDGTAWDELRRPADDVLFPGYREKMRFAALSGAGVGVANYGDFWLSLRESMIAHRASVFDQNSALFVVELEQKLRNAQPALLGHRAPWDERRK